MNEKYIVIGKKYKLLQAEEENPECGALMGFSAGQIIQVNEIGLGKKGGSWNIEVGRIGKEMEIIGFTDASNLEEIEEIK